jgi:hypothetical protein
MSRPDHDTRNLQRPLAGTTVVVMEAITTELDTCADCGIGIREGERAFAFGEDGSLCMACGLRRGGAYDEVNDRWTVAPAVDDLLVRLESLAH